LTIAVEMVARPELLLFLGKPPTPLTSPNPHLTQSPQMSPPPAWTAKRPGPSASSSAALPTAARQSSAPSTSRPHSSLRCLTASSCSRRGETSSTLARSAPTRPP
jgi:hypothetical protein